LEEGLKKRGGRKGRKGRKGSKMRRSERKSIGKVSDEAKGQGK